MRGLSKQTGPSRSLLMLALVMLLLVTTSALGVVYTSYKNRQLFISLQNLQSQGTRLQVQLGQLLLEESTWSSPAIVEQIAVSTLGMSRPAEEQLVIASSAASSSRTEKSSLTIAQANADAY